MAVIEDDDTALVDSVLDELDNLGAKVARIKADGMKPDDVGAAAVAAVFGLPQ
ncbi:MAG TPA: hypothetical protein VHD87_04015 [Acidimicrobiales bacterium]|nr:hypothetical protein [Acidimicrobiales bacterium]